MNRWTHDKKLRGGNDLCYVADCISSEFQREKRTIRKPDDGKDEGLCGPGQAAYFMATHNVPSGKLILALLLGITIAFARTGDARGEDLVEFGSDSLGNVFYYDRDSVKKKSGRVTVWTTMRWSDADRRKSDMIAELKKRIDCPGCERLSLKKDLSEIRCREGRMRKITFVFYDREDRVLYRWTGPAAEEWEVILPGTFQDVLKRAVCP